MNNIQLILSKTNAYDEVPYESHPYSASHPYHLMTLGTLFGMNPTNPEKARILELGCAAGGNLIPHAVNYPNAEFIGVDLSKIHINEAKTTSSSLGLKNIEFYHCSITDVGENFGKFDYIICHGVISWVPEYVRTKIFEICKKNLNQQGIAYVSYNTLPGWNTIRTIRDMMMFHSNIFSNINEKITQARMLLEFVKDSLEHSKSPHAEILKTEAALLAKQSDYYLRHDHLEEENKQYYFNEFMEEVKKHNLQYLSDCSVSTMYVGNMPKKVVEKLQEVNDIVRTEQYMDFITNRRFRATLLCHDSVLLNRNISNDALLKYNMILNIVPEKKFTEIDLNNPSESLRFFYNGNKDLAISTSSVFMKAIFYTFNENINNPISFNTLITTANNKLKENKLIDLKNDFLNNMMQLFLQGYLNITLKKARNKINIVKPKVSKIIFYQVSNTLKMWVTNLMHDVVMITSFEKIALRYMDGKNDKNQLLGLIMQHINNGELVFSRDGEKVDDATQIRKELVTFLDVAINKAAVNALLV